MFKTYTIFKQLFLMKNHLIILTFIFTLNVNFLLSQTFELEISTDNDEIALDALQLDDSTYIILAQAGDYYAHDYPLLSLFKINNQGSIIKHFQINIDNGFILNSAQNIFIDTTNDFVITGNCKNIESGYYSQYFCRIDENFEFIMDTITGPTDTNDIVVDFIVNKHNNIVAVGRVDKTTNDKLLIKEFTSFGEIVKRREIEWAAYMATSIVEYPEKDVYHLITSASTSAILEINTSDLEIVDTTLFSFYFEGLKVKKNPGGNKSVVAGKKYFLPYEQNFKLTFAISDVEMQISEEYVLGQPDTNYFYITNCVDFANDTVFYLAATHNFTPMPPFFYDERRWIFMNKLKTDGTIIWQKFYKGEVNYMPFKILATNDGGALILSHKYDWNNPVPNQGDIHILKIDSTGWYEGLPTGTGQYDQQKQILVYPNPAHDIVHLVPGLYSDLQLTIYNQSGKLLITRAMPSHTSIDISDYIAGVYIYVIKNNKGFIEKGKIIKE